MLQSEWAEKPRANSAAESAEMPEETSFLRKNQTLYVQAHFLSLSCMVTTAPLNPETYTCERDSLHVNPYS